MVGSGKLSFRTVGAGVAQGLVKQIGRFHARTASRHEFKSMMLSHNAASVGWLDTPIEHAPLPDWRMAAPIPHDAGAPDGARGYASQRRREGGEDLYSTPAKAVG